jgi:hypothetical protein
MTRQIYETEADKENELAVAKDIEQLYGCIMRANPELDHIDYVTEWPSGKISNAEIRCRPGMKWGQYSTVWMSALKLAHAAQLMRQGQSFSFFVRPSDGGLYKWTARTDDFRKLKNTWGGKNAQVIDDPQWLVEVPLTLFDKILPVP